VALSALGLDLAWSPRHPSAACALDGTGGVTCETGLGSDADIVAWVERHLEERTVVAADIPLAVPNQTGMRPCERELHHLYGAKHAGPYPSNRSLLLRWGEVRGEVLAAGLARSGFADPFAGGRRVLLEVYPHPGLVAVFAMPERLSYKRGPVAKRRSGLRRLRLFGDAPTGHIAAPFTPR
jgi:predicted RNase H-like nuclease